MFLEETTVKITVQCSCNKLCEIENKIDLRGGDKV